MVTETDGIDVTYGGQMLSAQRVKDGLMVST